MVQHGIFALSGAQWAQFLLLAASQSAGCVGYFEITGVGKGILNS